MNGKRVTQMGSHSVLGRYQPLERVLCVDNFDEGFSGWAPAEDARPGPRALPQLSNLPTWDVGTYGSWDTYALKVPTLPLPGSTGVAEKRPAIPPVSVLRIETYFVHATEMMDFRLGETDIHSFGVSVQCAEQLPMTAHYLNCADGELVQRWEGMEPSHQKLGYNRSPTKFQWLYLGVTFDLTRTTILEINCCGRHMAPVRFSDRETAERRLRSPDAIRFMVTTNSRKRCHLFLDSVVMSSQLERAHE